MITKPNKNLNKSLQDLISVAKTQQNCKNWNYNRK